jgi:hypothetical protein
MEGLEKNPMIKSVYETLKNQEADKIAIKFDAKLDGQKYTIEITIKEAD